MQRERQTPSKGWHLDNEAEVALALALEALALALRLLWLDKTNTAMDVVYFEASRTTRTKQKYL